MAKNTGTGVTDAVIPLGNGAATYDVYQQGGHRQVQTLEDRDAIKIEDGVLDPDGISSGRRKFGMTVYVAQNDTTYKLFKDGFLELPTEQRLEVLANNENWTEVTASAGGGGGLSFVQYSPTTTYQPGDYVVFKNQLYKCVGQTTGFDPDLLAYEDLDSGEITVYWELVLGLTYDIAKGIANATYIRETNPVATRLDLADVQENMFTQIEINVFSGTPQITPYTPVRNRLYFGFGKLAKYKGNGGVQYTTFNPELDSDWETIAVPPIPFPTTFPFLAQPGRLYYKNNTLYKFIKNSGYSIQSDNSNDTSYWEVVAGGSGNNNTSGVANIVVPRYQATPMGYNTLGEVFQNNTDVYIPVVLFSTYEDVPAGEEPTDGGRIFNIQGNGCEMGLNSDWTVYGWQSRDANYYTTNPQGSNINRIQIYGGGDQSYFRNAYFGDFGLNNKSESQPLTVTLTDCEINFGVQGALWAISENGMPFTVILRGTTRFNGGNIGINDVGAGVTVLDLRGEGAAIVGYRGDNATGFANLAALSTEYVNNGTMITEFHTSDLLADVPGQSYDLQDAVINGNGCNILVANNADLLLPGTRLRNVNLYNGNDVNPIQLSNDAQLRNVELQNGRFDISGHVTLHDGVISGGVTLTGSGVLTLRGYVETDANFAANLPDSIRVSDERDSPLYPVFTNVDVSYTSNDNVMLDLFPYGVQGTRYINLISENSITGAITHIRSTAGRLHIRMPYNGRGIGTDYGQPMTPTAEGAISFRISQYGNNTASGSVRFFATSPGSFGYAEFQRIKGDDNVSDVFIEVNRTLS